ncbi:hypothetical protein MAPG_01296 [Magnaporthiopsis poae ATCC 64411]|uniref:Uncharacterized protein n=1 Tax=Magnaporthiopsis poae (strain ATCC 64411 / 73-15) TaxID=644358 RepID=A0A0C4DNB5_MAGP6|nr:hypothetical protein MAPG_01296 [Magnaporthiopsis poae ATCC 64411]
MLRSRPPSAEENACSLSLRIPRQPRVTTLQWKKRRKMPRPPLRARARQQPLAKPSASRGPARRRPPPSPPLAAPATAPAATSTAADNGRDATAEASIVSGADSDAADLPELPLFNTTFHTYRASPLHVGPQPLTAERLACVAPFVSRLFGLGRREGVRAARRGHLSRDV